MDDPVNKPPHYQADNFECIDVIEHCLSPSEYQGYLKGCIIKYMYRHNYKGNPEQDLQKALWYLNRVVNAPTSVKTPESQNCAPDGYACNCAECQYLRRNDA